MPKQSKYHWKHAPTYPIIVPKPFNDILLLTAIALDRGLLTEAELHQIIQEKLK
jgi:hypothetical protein